MNDIRTPLKKDGILIVDATNEPFCYMGEPAQYAGDIQQMVPNCGVKAAAIVDAFARIARLEADNARLREELEAERKRPLMLWFAENAEEPISEDDIADALGSPEVAEMWMARQLPSEWVAVHPGEEEDWLSWHETEEAARAALNADADKTEGDE